MNTPSGPNAYPQPDPERVRRALAAMRARRTRLRRARIAAVSGVFVVAAAVVVLAVQLSPSGSRGLNVEGGSSTTLVTTSTSTATTAPTTTTTTTPSSTTQTPTTTRAGTRVIVYQPFTDAGAVRSGLHVTASVTGTCVSGESQRTFRCFDSSGAAGIYDPCFTGPHGTTGTLVCPGNPATGDVVEFHATSVTSQPPPTATRPWAMQLSGGQVCLFVSAAWGGLGPYDCQFGNASATPADCRQPQSGRPWWTTECQDEKTSASPFASESVTTLWF